MWNVESRWTFVRFQIEEVLNRRARSGAVFDAEVTARRIDRLRPGVRREGLQTTRQAAIELRLQRVVARRADRFRVSDVGDHPRHRAFRVDRRERRAVRRGCRRSVRKTGIREASVAAADIRHRHHRLRSELTLDFDVPLIRVAVLVVRIIGERAGDRRPWIRGRHRRWKRADQAGEPVDFFMQPRRRGRAVLGRLGKLGCETEARQG